jgi:hypothetical protein
MSGTGSPPAAPPTSTPAPTLILTQTDVSGWLNLDGTEDPDQVTAAIETATDAVIDELGWDPRQQVYTEIRDSVGSTTLVVGNQLITGVSAINLMYPGQPPVPFDIQGVTWDPKAPIIYNLCRFPRGRQLVQVIYTAGYPTLPNPILQATRYTIKAMLDGSGVDFNATGESYSGVLSQTFWQQGPATCPPSAVRLLRFYRRTI